MFNICLTFNQLFAFHKIKVLTWYDNLLTTTNYYSLCEDVAGILMFLPLFSLSFSVCSHFLLLSSAYVAVGQCTCLFSLCICSCLRVSFRWHKFLPFPPLNNALSSNKSFYKEKDPIWVNISRFYQDIGIYELPLRLKVRSHIWFWLRLIWSSALVQCNTPFQNCS